jgi:hypothetical protein
MLVSLVVGVNNLAVQSSWIVRIMRTRWTRPAIRWLANRGRAPGTSSVDLFEATIAAVHPADGSLPTGQLFHAAGPSPDGWTIVAVHDAKASWETFRDSTLMPRMNQGIEGGFSSPPEETEFDVVNEVRA